MEEALRKLLAAYAPLAALVGTRIYWGEIPQGVSGDAVVLYKISGGASYTHDGPSDLKATRVQINTRADTLTEAWAIARAIETRLSGFRGTHEGIDFDGIFLEDDDILPSEKVGAHTYKGTRSDYAVWAKPTD